MLKTLIQYCGDEVSAEKNENLNGKAQRFNEGRCKF